MNASLTEDEERHIANLRMYLNNRDEHVHRLIDQYEQGNKWCLAGFVVGYLPLRLRERINAHAKNPAPDPVRDFLVKEFEDGLDVYQLNPPNLLRILAGYTSLMWKSEAR